MQKRVSALSPGDTTQIPTTVAVNRKSLQSQLLRDRWLYIFLVPVVAYYMVFKYAPMGGLVIAFKDYRLGDGIAGSDWVGLAHFRHLFSSRDFFRVLKNTLLLNVYAISAGFPIPIILALLLNEIRTSALKKGIQLTIYLPHFISWVILGGIAITVLSPSQGFVNRIVDALFGVRIFFLGESTWWPVVFVATGIWKEAGWGTIIYLAAMSTIDPQLYEAARIDGATRLQRVWHVTLPGIAVTISILLILRLGRMLEIGFEQVFMLQNLAVMDVSDVISTYVYRHGIEGFRYSYTTALGVFQSGIGFVLLLTANSIANRIGRAAIW